MKEENTRHRFPMLLLRSFARWILLPVLVISASIAVVAIGTHYYQEYRDRELAIPKTWPTNELSFNRRATLKTSWRPTGYTGELYYQFFVTPISEKFVSRYWARKDIDQVYFFFDFEDSAGFKLQRIEIKLEEMAGWAVDSVETIEFKQSTPFDRDRYKNTARVIVRWAGAFDKIAAAIDRETKKLPMVEARFKSVQELVASAEFYALKPSEQEQALLGIDPDFRKLNDEERKDAIQELNRQWKNRRVR